MICSFSCSKTQLLFETGKATGFLKSIQKPAKRKLTMLYLAQELDDLRIPPVNRLEALTGDRFGQYSIRINKQYRLCFRWVAGNVFDVEIVDYHN
jgi:proteic killer suppression protein